MFSKKNALLAFILVMVMVMTVFAGCGSQPKNNQSSASTVSADTTVAVEPSTTVSADTTVAVEPSTATAPAKKVHLTC